MKSKTKKLWFNYMGLILLLMFIVNITISVSGVVISDTITLSPLEEEIIPLKIHDGDEVLISVVMSSGEIYVEIYESAAYPSLSYYEEDWGPVSTTLSAYFEPTWTDTFYIVFYNANTMSSASFTYTINHDQAFQTNLIINLAIAGGLLGVILVVNFTGKKNPNISS
jgi:hypothetical protein